MSIRRFQSSILKRYLNSCLRCCFYIAKQSIERKILCYFGNPHRRLKRMKAIITADIIPFRQICFYRSLIHYMRSTTAICEDNQSDNTSDRTSQCVTQALIQICVFRAEWLQFLTALHVPVVLSSTHPH